MASEEPVPVDLYIYDLTYGLASVLSPAIVGQQVEGVWHTAVVVYDREFFYGQDGVTSCPPGSTQLGAPHKIERLGDTFVPFQVLVDYLQGLATSTYRGSEYHLLRHNCNHFSEEVAGFLCGAHIPKHILAQPDALPPALRTALEATLTQMLPHPTQAVYADGVRHSRRDSPDFLTLNNQIEEARVQTAELDKRRATLADKLARRERRREKKRKKLNGTIDQVDPELDIEEAGMAEAVEALPGGSGVVEAGAGAGVNLGGGSLQERRDEEARRRTAYPPIVYKDIDVVSEFEKLAKELEGGKLSETETQSLDELRQYLVHGEGSWVLGDEFLDFIGAVLLESRFSQSARICVLRCLAGAALRDDAALLLHQDRRRHALLSHAYNIDTLPIEEQRAVLLFMCNLFESISSSEWLLYISEWEDVTGRPLSNIRVTTKVCVHGVVSEEEALRELGTALLHNLAGKEVKTVRLGATRALRELLPKHAKSRVFDEVCVELAMAALQLLGGGGGAGGSGGAGAAVSEEHAYRATRALAGLAVRAQDVPMVIQMVGPSPDAYRGTSQRVDEQIDLIMKTLK